MTKSGPPRKPTELKLLHGTYRSDRANPDEPMPAGELGPAPSRLDQDQAEAWSEIAAQAWWSTASDRVGAELLACTLGDIRRLRRELKDEPFLVQGSRGQVRNPKSYLLREAEALAVRLLAEFGLTPASRARVETPRRNEDEVRQIQPRQR